MKSRYVQCKKMCTQGNSWTHTLSFHRFETALYYLCKGQGYLEVNVIRRSKSLVHYIAKHNVCRTQERCVDLNKISVKTKGYPLSRTTDHLP